ncbi:probable alpha-aspartyl dipeptidase [Lucilia cuprina]|uniref:probable alpha-aspartyl dipeptidase n=1 Tax=Lucilia cuprina TaxID=7375 RepID=UPI001F05EF78|nr:probable alpha-aspartyl dipeptidase [Lucilia cuprina]
MKALLKMTAERSLLLMSSSRVFGYGFLEHTKEDITKFLNKKSVTKILFVPYALPDHDAYTDVVRNALSPWGYEVESIHTKPNAIEAVASAQAIFVGGGNSFVLLKTLYDLNLVEAIREQTLNKGTPYMGSSAGTNVATRSINTTNDMPMAYPPTFEALNLVPFNINPHYLETDPNTEHKGETRDQRLEEFLLIHKRPVLGLREGTAVLVEGDKATLIGDRRAKLFRPNLEPIEFEPNSDLSFLLNDV